MSRMSGSNPFFYDAASGWQERRMCQFPAGRADRLVLGSGVIDAASGWQERGMGRLPAGGASGFGPVVAMSPNVVISGIILPDWVRSESISGGFIGAYSRETCRYCEQEITSEWVGFWGQALSSGDYNNRCCLNCAGFRYDRDMPPREQWIRESVPLLPGTPPLVLADWLSENGRGADEEYLRRRYAGAP